MRDKEKSCPANPLQMVDCLYGELVSHYNGAEDSEIRAASKLLIVALEKFKCHGGPQWRRLVAAYFDLINEEPEKFERIIRCQRHAGKPLM